MLDVHQYGLLRALQSQSDKRLLVAWMLTPNDGSQDGRLRSYLDAPAAWAKFDRELFVGLTDLLRSASQPAVSLIEGSGVLPRASFYSAVVPDTRRERGEWFNGLLRAASGVDLVFLDPDNGIEVPTKPGGRAGSSKYVMWNEIEGLWTGGYSILIYQHFCRESREVFAERIAGDLLSHTGAGSIIGFRTSHVLFLLAAQDCHLHWFRNAIKLLSNRWNNQIKAMGLCGKPILFQ